MSTPKSFSEDLAEFFGILLGDGSVTDYFAKVYLNLQLESAYADFLQSTCGKLFPGATISIYKKPKRGVIEIQISSKSVCNYLRSIGFDPQSRSVPPWILKNEYFTIATLRGLFDTEGSVGLKYVDGKHGKRMYKQITFTNKNSNLLTFVQQALSQLGYSPTQNSTKNIYISNTHDIQHYISTIGSHNEKMLDKFAIVTRDGYAYTGMV